MIDSCLMVVVVAFVSAEPALSQNVVEIIRNVRENEARFRDIDVTLEKVHSVGPIVKKAQVAGAPSGEAGFVGMIQSKRDIHFVSQGDRFRVEIAGDSKMSDGKTVSENLIKAFDGRTTRQLGRDLMAGEAPGKNEQLAIFRPHMLLYPFLDPLSLSELLEQGEYAGKSEKRNFQHAVEYEASELVNEIPCVRVMVTNSMKGQPDWYNRWQLWLATDRHYIPCQVRSYTRPFSKDSPVGEGQVTRWLETADGEWLPAEGKYTAFNKFALKDQGLKQVQWAESFAVRKASLNPAYQDSYFHTLPMPRAK